MIAMFSASQFSSFQSYGSCSCLCSLALWHMAKSAVATPQKEAPKRKLFINKKGNNAAEILETPKKEAGTRRLVRKTSDDAATRCLRLKLGMFPQSQVDNNANSQGLTPVMMVKKELRRLKPAKLHIALSFWTSVVKECKLTGTLCDGLVAPVDDEEVGKPLDSALREAHCSNPAQKSCSRLLQLLEYLGPCNRTEYYGLVSGAVQSPSMSKGMSGTIVLAVLQYSARIRADRLFPHYWKELAPAFDKMLSEMWAKAQSKGMPRVNWIRAWRNCLSLFLDMEIATAVEKSVEEKTAIDNKQLETLVMSSIIGSELWAPESQLSESSSYIAEIERRLVTLEDENFFEEEMSSFRKICMHQAEALDLEAWRSCDGGMQISANFLSGLVSAPQLNPNDEWLLRLQARVKTLCVSNGAVRRFPWEVALYGASAPLDGCPTTVSIPERLVLDIANARDFVFAQLGDGWNSIAKCRELVKTNLTEIMKAD